MYGIVVKSKSLLIGMLFDIKTWTCYWKCMGLLFFRAFISSASQINERKICCQTIEANIYPLSIAVSMPWSIFKVATILTIIPWVTNSSFSNNSKFTYNLANVFISRPVAIYKLQLCQVFNNNYTLTGSQKSFFKTLIFMSSSPHPLKMICDNGNSNQIKLF